MRTELEPHDIKAIVDAVIQQLAPMVTELKALASIPSNPQQPQAPTPRSAANSNEKAILNRVEVNKLTGIGKTTLWRLEKKGNFPAKIQLSSGRVGWVYKEIIEWIESRTTISSC